MRKAVLTGSDNGRVFSMYLCLKTSCTVYMCAILEVAEFGM